MSTGIEPVSGQLGNTRAGEPYDAGNMSGWYTQSLAIPIKPRVTCQ